MIGRGRWLVSAVAGVVAGAAFAVPAHADPTGLTGTIVDLAGTPVAGACVTVFNSEGAEVASGCADPAGRYAVPTVPDGVYKARARAAGYTDLWARQRLDQERADPIWISGSAVTTVDFTMFRAPGVFRGRITNAAGAPVAGAVVAAHLVPRTDPFFGIHASADGNGEYRLPVPPGQYRISFSHNRIGHIWAYGKERPDEAELFTVGEGQEVVVNDRFLPTATIEVTVRDEVDGRRITRGCVFGAGRSTCESERGVFRLTDVPPGNHILNVAPEGTHWPTDVVAAAVRGETTRLTVRVRRAASVVTTVRDAETSAPLANVCAQMVHKDGGVVSRNLRFCTGPSGRLVIGPMQPSTFDLLVDSLDNSYGMQWVGRHGGTGDRRRARTITTSLDAPVFLPPIRMDRPGTITGVVRDKETGAPVQGVCAYPFAHDPRRGGDFGEPFCTDAQGRYTRAGMGPYHWPVEFVSMFSSNDYAWQWSGDKSNRFDATTVRVRSGHTSTMDARLVHGGQITGLVRGAAGHPQSANIDVFNATTGDYAGPGVWTNLSGDPYTLGRLSSQAVKIHYFVSSPNTADCWFDRRTGFDTATPVRVTAGQSRTLDLTGCG